MEQLKPAKVIKKGKNIYELLNASFKGVKRLFFLAYIIAAGDNAYQEAGIKNNKMYFLPRANIENYYIFIDGRNFYDQPINELIKPYDEVRKVSARYGDGYTTGCLLDYRYFKDNYKLIAVDLSKKKVLDVDPRAIQQIVFQGVVGGDNCTTIRLHTFLGQSKETMLDFLKEQQNWYKWSNTVK